MNPLKAMSPEALIFNIERQKMWAKHYAAQHNLYAVAICNEIVRQLRTQLGVQGGKQ